MVFIKIGRKLSYFCNKNTKVSSAGDSAFRLPETAFSQLQISGYAPESNHVYVFALLISVPPEFSLMPRFKSIIFYQNKPKIKLFLQKIKFFECWGLPSQTHQWPPVDGVGSPRPRNRPFPHCRFLVTRLILNVCSSYSQIIGSYNEKLLS